MTSAQRTRGGPGTARRALAALFVAGLALAGLVALAPPASAHPLGNFTTNTSTLLTLGPERVELDYLVDFAEIPALQTRQRIDVSGDSELSRAERASYLETQCARVGAGLSLEVDGADLTLGPAESALAFRPGEAGLQTLRVSCRWSLPGESDDGVSTLEIRDTNFDDRLGWREIVTATDGTVIEQSDALESSPTRRLTAYPQNQLSSPLDQRSATISFRPGAGEPAAVGPTGTLPASADRLQSSFFGLISRQRLTPLFALLAMVTALALGAVHAFAPGHGKTLMAAFLVSREGTARQALGLGLTVAATHTLGVLLLGVVIATTQAASPASLYPWLSLISGACFAFVGGWLLRRALRRRGHHHHPHEHVHPHPVPVPVGAGAVRLRPAPARSEPVGVPTPSPASEPAPTWRSLALPGLAGGLTPSPSALVVLLSGVALGRTWYAVLLVVAYGLGMAATLVAAGWLLLRASDRLQRFTAGTEGGRLGRLVARLPVVTASVVIVGGTLIALRSAVALLA